MFSAGAIVTSVQLDEANPVFCCSTNFKEGTSQEMTALVPEGRMLRDDDNVNGERCSVWMYGRRKGGDVSVYP